ncbi:uncharacterized protein EI90DRAFT_2504929 [Cantharellus anzutake]|uniref:uncharacterized protein n=1 Tax=Cantharellus anzutake TaxID=1750568 RepID=UPI00190493E8|nr:uncharacterized protein EI90DRAFT_2504929 [Cantharellus anzutake]KAF8321477.1 hypothetical protein EI90DRAFT_2504929 [Cantharellus anzutake]
MSSSNSREAQFEHIVSALRNSLGAASGRVRRVFLDAIRKTAVEFQFVAIGLRQACLVDSVSVDRLILDDVVGQLRKISSGFEGTFVLQEPSSSQVFLVNANILLAELRNGRPTETHFITASDVPKRIPCPRGVRSALSFLEERFRDVGASDCIIGVDLPPMSTSDAIALAGYLLEYPVSYAPVLDTAQSQVFLSNVPLKLVNVSLELAGRRSLSPVRLPMWWL